MVIRGDLDVTFSPVGVSLEYPRLSLPLVASATEPPPLTDWSKAHMPK